MEKEKDKLVLNFFNEQAQYCKVCICSKCVNTEFNTHNGEHNKCLIGHCDITPGQINCCSGTKYCTDYQLSYMR